MDRMSTESNSPFSQKTLQIAERFAGEALRASQSHGPLHPPANREAVDFEDYKTACSEMLGAEPVLDPKMLEERVRFIMQDSKLKIHFRTGDRCRLAIVPFSNYGNPLTPEEIKSGEYLRTIMINRDGKTINGFNSHASYAADFLPKEMQAIEFTIGEYEKEGDFDITDNDRKKIAEQYTQAFRKLQRLMGGAHEQN